MTNSIQSTDYSATVEACTNAVRQDINTVNKWETAGQKVRAFFGTESAMLEVKAQFIADAILPAIDKRHAKVLNTELPRKNSKEFNALDEGQRDTWEYVNQAKKDARATLNTYFSRIVGYAFPAEKKDSEATTLKTKIQTQIADLLKKCEKSTDADFDIVETAKALQNVLTAVNK
jgi:DNA-binding transcriptional regulator GbsR (MarR family)